MKTVWRLLQVEGFKKLLWSRRSIIKSLSFCESCSPQKSALLCPVWVTSFPAPELGHTHRCGTEFTCAEPFRSLITLLLHLSVGTSAHVWASHQARGHLVSVSRGGWWGPCVTWGSQRAAVSWEDPEEEKQQAFSPGAWQMWFISLQAG